VELDVNFYRTLQVSVRYAKRDIDMAYLSLRYVMVLVTLRAKLSGAVYYNRSWVCVWVCLWVCCHDNSKLRASILTKLGL